MNKPWILILFGLLAGLLAAGGILLISRPAQGVPIALQPAPSPTYPAPLAPSSTPVPILIQIDGEVNSPGVYPLPIGSRVDELLQAAGGLTDNADTDRVNIVSVLHDGDYYYIPAAGETIPETAANSPDNLQVSQDPSFQYPINLNLASQEELESLPGIGPTKAMDIISYREEHGAFLSVDALVNVPGIGENTVDSLREYLIVE